MRIPPAIDSTMWEVVESDDTTLMDEFAVRYPEYKGELAKRLTMVRDLKGSRPKAAVKPAFQPRKDIVIAERGLSWTTSTVLIAVAGAVLLTFGSIRLYDQFRTSQNVQPPVAQPEGTGPDLTRYEPPPAQNQTSPPDTTGGQQQPQQPEIKQPEIDPAQVDPFQRRVTVTVEDGTLSSVLQLIATQANLVLEAAPGMPNDRIRAQYVNLPAMKVLEDLGRNFGFTALKQGRRNALLVPARDRSQTGGDPASIGDQNHTNTTGSTPLTGPVDSRKPDASEGALPPVGN